MADMLGRRLRRERRSVCRFGCCTRTNAHRVRKTKNERARDKRSWQKERYDGHGESYKYRYSGGVSDLIEQVVRD